MGRSWRSSRTKEDEKGYKPFLIYSSSGNNFPEEAIGGEDDEEEGKETLHHLLRQDGGEDDEEDASSHSPSSRRRPAADMDCSRRAGGSRDPGRERHDQKSTTSAPQGFTPWDRRNDSGALGTALLCKYTRNVFFHLDGRR